MRSSVDVLDGTATSVPLAVSQEPSKPMQQQVQQPEVASPTKLIEVEQPTPIKKVVEAVEEEIEQEVQDIEVKDIDDVVEDVTGDGEIEEEEDVDEEEQMAEEEGEEGEEEVS